MKIDWAALGVVAAVSIVAAVVFSLLLSFGIRFVSAARVHASRGERQTATRTAGYAFIGCAGLLVLFGIYLIIPQLH